MKKRVISILLGLVFVLALIIVPFSVPVRASSLSDETIWMFLVQATGSAAGYHISSSGTEHGGSGGMFPDFYSDMFTQWQASYGGDAMALNTWIDGNVALSGEGTNVEFTVLEGGGGIDPITGTAIDAMGFLIAQALVDKMAEFWGWFNENILGATSADAVDGVNAGVGGNFGEAPVSSLTGAIAYPFPALFHRSNNLVNLTDVLSSSAPICYVITAPAANGIVTLFALSESPFVLRHYSLSSNPSNYSEVSSLPSNCGLYYAQFASFNPASYVDVPSSSSFSEAELQNMLNSSDVETVSNVATTVGYKPGTEIIEFPESDPDSDPEEEPAPVPYIFPQEWPSDLPAPDPDTGAVPADDAIPWIIDGFTDGDGDISYDDDPEPDPDNPTPSRPIQSPGLADVFPFCLPFDVYHFFQALAAEPVAPHFEWEMQIPGIIDYTWVIDLSAFNSVAQILRTVELLAFCVGLAFVTRSMFIRG